MIYFLFQIEQKKDSSNFEAIKEMKKDITNCPFEKETNHKTPKWSGKNWRWKKEV